MGMFQSRLTTINDIPSLGPFFFVDPDYSSEEAKSMVDSLSVTDRRKLLPFILVVLVDTYL